MVRKLLASLLLLALYSLDAHAQLLVRYPNLNGTGEQGLGYKMLDLALRTAGTPYRIEQRRDLANNDRIRLMLDVGEVDVVDFGTSPEFEQRYTAVYFPIDRGLNGWRLLVVRRADAAKFAAINSVGELKHFIAGQGQGWSDVNVLRHAGLEVATVPQIEKLFRGLERGRFDFLPLGLNEAYSLTEHYAPSSQALCLDTHLVLVYPFARLFFVRKGNLALRELIHSGLVKAFADGSFQRMLASDPGYAEALRRAQLKQRAKLALDNPFLSAEFRKIPEAYFLK